jgi:hypothetical protein
VSKSWGLLVVDARVVADVRASMAERCSQVTRRLLGVQGSTCCRRPAGFRWCTGSESHNVVNVVGIAGVVNGGSECGMAGAGLGGSVVGVGQGSDARDAVARLGVGVTGSGWGVAGTVPYVRVLWAGSNWRGGVIGLVGRGRVNGSIGRVTVSVGRGRVNGSIGRGAGTWGRQRSIVTGLGRLVECTGL